MEQKLQQIRDVRVVTAAKAIRIAWLDERLEAEARGDRQRAADAATLVSECDRKIAALQARGSNLLELQP